MLIKIDLDSGMRWICAISHFQSSYLKNNGLVVLLEVEGKDVSEHESGAALAEHIYGLLQELHFNPRHVVLLHLLHLLLNLSIELVLKAQTLHVVHVAVAVEQVPLQGCPGALHTQCRELALTQEHVQILESLGLIRCTGFKNTKHQNYIYFFKKNFLTKLYTYPDS